MILLRLIDGLWPVAYLAGLLVTFRYFRKHGKPVFVLLLVYFAMGIYSHTLARHVDRFFMSRTVTDITHEQLEKFEAYQKDSEDLYVKHFGVTPGHTTTAVRWIQFPLGQILLVITLFLVGKRIESMTPNQAVHAMGASALQHDG
ncbi:MAG: hypothetical protein PHR35_22895 [Kiritimatiellae bacterium]|nr:hypothetical protein [Kiritimatiellia bacterium]